MELVKTGTTGLDEILFGGLIPNNALLIEGTPGAGKTTLGLQYVYRGAKDYGQPGIIITFEEEPEKLYRDALVFGWDLKALEKKNLLRIIPSSPEAVRDMLLKPESGFTRLSKGIGANRIMVDSLTHFRRITDNVQELRILLNKFLTGLMKLTNSAVLIKEVETFAEDGANIEQYITDTVVRLSYEQRSRQRRERYLEVIKSRGQNHLSGKHGMLFCSSGLEVYPSCGLYYRRDSDSASDPSDPRAVALQGKNRRKKASRGNQDKSSGIKGLDQMCRGGFPAGSAGVVAGSSGTGKSVLALQFLAEGLKTGEDVLLVSFEQGEEELTSYGNSFGIKLEQYLKNGQLTLWKLDTIDLSVDQFLHRLKDYLAGQSPGRIVVDGLTQLRHSVADEDYLADYLGAMLKIFKGCGAASLFTFEIDKMFGAFEINSRRTLGLFDNLLLLRYVELEGEIRRAIALIKMRATDHEKAIHEYVISSAGIEVKPKFEGRVDVMGGGGGGGQSQTVELKDILGDATRWADATRRMRERQKQSRR